MALRTKTREQLYQMHTYRAGRVEVLPLRGFFHTVEKVQGHGVRIPDLTIASFSAQTSTPTAAIISAPGRLYFVWAASGSTSTLDAIVQVTDNSIVVASGKVQSTRAMEMYFYDSIDGVGVKTTTDIKILAVAAADGTSNPAAADRPDVVVVYGLDTVNTEDANLINTIYG